MYQERAHPAFLTTLFYIEDWREESFDLIKENPKKLINFGWSQSSKSFIIPKIQKENIEYFEHESALNFFQNNSFTYLAHPKEWHLQWPLELGKYPKYAYNHIIMLSYYRWRISCWK